MYQVFDIRTGQVMGVYSSLKRATRRIDKLDMEYGAYRYSYRNLSHNTGGN
jgi:hypothetical protein